MPRAEIILFKRGSAAGSPKNVVAGALQHKRPGVEPNSQPHKHFLSCKVRSPGLQ